MILRKGSQGEYVRELQNLLNQRLIPSPSLSDDGIFGQKTSTAVWNFQKHNWLVEDGEVGPCTWAALRLVEKYITFHKLVPLIPQTDPTACWLAVTSMLLKQSLSRASCPPELINQNGALLNDSELLTPKVSQLYAKHFFLRLYHARSWTPTGLADILRLGPVATNVLWNTTAYTGGKGSDSHWVVIAGIRGDGTSQGTTLRILNPLPVNMGEERSYNHYKLLNAHPGLTYQFFQKYY